MEEKKYSKSLFIFRRDLRLEDNTGLINALADSNTVICCFIFDPRQVGSNPYRSDNCVQFMVESLQDLDNQLKKKKSKLYVFHGKAPEIVGKLVKSEKIEAVYVNRDFTPFSIKRDKAIATACKKSKAEFVTFDDLLLNPPERVKTGSGSFYTVFTPFYKKSITIPVDKPRRNSYSNYYKKSVKGDVGIAWSKKVLGKDNPQIALHGGRKNALKVLSNLSKYKHYKKERDIMALDKTSHLSAHHKFGTVSIRETYYAIVNKLGRSHPLLRQLYWRDFFTQVAFHEPSVFGHAFRKKYDKVKWVNSKAKFKAWCSGQTGFPLVDAGMRELNATGYMHNRARMVVGQFLVKDLHIDWRWGEKYFAQKLIDYDPCVNNGNWQWCASTGCDSQPYFRIFNPWRQQERFDPDCKYIKKWVPELKSLPAKAIHKLFKQRPLGDVDYPKPICNHSEEAAKAKAWFASCR